MSVLCSTIIYLHEKASSFVVQKGKRNRIEAKFVNFFPSNWRTVFVFISFKTSVFRE